MLKRIMCVWMVLLTVIKIASLSFVLSTDGGRLPLAVYISTGIVAALGLGLLCKRIIGWLSQRALMVYLVLEMVSVLFNLVYMKIFSRIEVTLMDLAVIGTIANLLMDFVLLFQARRVRLHSRAAEEAAV